MGPLPADRAHRRTDLGLCGQRSKALAGSVCKRSQGPTTSPSMTRSHLQPHRTPGPAPDAAPMTLDTAHV
ncbi:unnamed protein product [Boreogadus saida]